MSRVPDKRSAPLQQATPTAIAVVIHAALLLALLHRQSVSIAPMRLPGTRLGSQPSLVYLPGRAPESAALARMAVPRTPPAAALAAKSVSLPETKSKVSTSATSPRNALPDATSGNDALGDGNVNIALATSFPTPKPDLTQLPNGTSGDVVLDIVIDAAGKVASITMSRGLGHGIDETVIATVQQWSFHPATRDGQPVPSEQELHFHYEKA